MIDDRLQGTGLDDRQIRQLDRTGTDNGPNYVRYNLCLEGTTTAWTSSLETGGAQSTTHPSNFSLTEAFVVGIGITVFEFYPGFSRRQILLPGRQKLESESYNRENDGRKWSYPTSAARGRAQQFKQDSEGCRHGRKHERSMQSRDFQHPSW